MQLNDSSERADMLLSKRTGVGFEPVTSWLRTRGTNHYTVTNMLKNNHHVTQLPVPASIAAGRKDFPSSTSLPNYSYSSEEEFKTCLCRNYAAFIE